MRTPTEIVEAVARELLPASHDVVMISDVARRAEEFRTVAVKADPSSPQRAIASACSTHLAKLHRSLQLTAFKL